MSLKQKLLNKTILLRLLKFFSEFNTDDLKTPNMLTTKRGFSFMCYICGVMVLNLDKEGMKCKLILLEMYYITDTHPRTEREGIHLVENTTSLAFSEIPRKRRG